MRLHLVFGTITVLLLALTISYKNRKAFSFAEVEKMAAELATQPYKAPEDPLGKELKKLNYDQVRDIRWKDQFTIWRERGRPFQAKLFHLGGLNHTPIKINIIEKQGAHVKRLIYSPLQFDFGKNQLKDPIPDDLGYAGFRIHYPIKQKDYLDEILVFQGSNYFRSLAKDQQWGLSARGVAIDTGAKKEEFPIFTTFWLKEAESGDDSMTIYALLDGPSVTGAYEFTVRPAQDTEMTVRSSLYFRKDVKRLGIAPLTSMYWFGENSRPNIQDFRPEVHDSDGLLILNGKEEWLWRPLSNSAVMRENSFVDDHPRGFGLLQRDRNFANYQDLEARYHIRPSAWVEPEGSWGKGSINLVQLATKDEFMDNIVAFWTPETPVKKGDVLHFNYRLLWTWNAPRESVAHATQTRIHYPVATEPAWIVIDFAGTELENRPADQKPVAEVSVDPPEVLKEIFVEKNEYEKAWRVSFSLNVQNAKKPIELRCRLMDKGQPISETWTYTWKP